MLQHGRASIFRHHFLQLHICRCTTTYYLCLRMYFSFLLYKQQRGTSQYWEAGCVVSSGSVCARATTSTAPRQLRKKINLFVTDSSILRRLELMFYLLEVCWIQCRWSTACMLCCTNRPCCAVEYGASKSRGGRVRWRSSQSGAHLCYLWMYAICTINAFVWAISLNHTSTAMYNMRESVMLVLQLKEKKTLYIWAKKLHYLDDSMEEHHWRPLPEYMCATLIVP